jgi:hypothetical protein
VAIEVGVGGLGVLRGLLSGFPRLFHGGLAVRFPGEFYSMVRG